MITKLTESDLDARIAEKRAPIRSACHVALDAAYPSDARPPMVRSIESEHPWLLLVYAVALVAGLALPAVIWGF